MHPRKEVFGQLETPRAVTEEAEHSGFRATELATNVHTRKEVSELLESPHAVIEEAGRNDDEVVCPPARRSLRFSST